MGEDDKTKVEAPPSAQQKEHSAVQEDNSEQESPPREKNEPPQYDCFMRVIRR